MNSIFFMILRRMRAPLLVLSTVYMVATLGFTLIPGIDDTGQPYRMDFFHSFYFVTFMGTTIGFGELPYPFTDAQRMWVVATVYVTVATWIYAIGSLISLLQNDTLKRAITERRFRQQVLVIREPFYLICGYGDTGSKLVDALRDQLIPASVLDISQERVDALVLSDHPMFVPSLCANASIPEYLVMAGLNHPDCAGIVAITDDNNANLHIAITSKVMNPGLNVICRSDQQDTADNMASFETDHIIDPFTTFADSLSLALYAPHHFLLDTWFRQSSRETLGEVMEVPSGHWILCGYGRFGRAVYKELINRGLKVSVIEPDAGISGLPAGTLKGLGTQADTLEEAGISGAGGIIAGADNDSNNLSIIVTARALNPNLFVITRQSDRSNNQLFEGIRADIVMGPSDVLARKIRSLLTNPLIDDFLSLARVHNDQWAASLSQRIRILADGRMPEVWSVVIDEDQATAVVRRIRNGGVVLVQDLLASHANRTDQHPALVLLHACEDGAFCLPEFDTILAEGDQLLLMASSQTRSMMQWNLQNDSVLEYVAGVDDRGDPKT